MKKLTAALVFAFAAILGVMSARADIPPVRYGPITFTAPGTLPVINLSGQSSCAFTVNPGNKSAQATIIPYGSSDGGLTYEVIPQLGSRTVTGNDSVFTFGSQIAPYLTNFYVEVALISGPNDVSEVCTTALGPSFADPSPTPTPDPPPTPTPSPTPTPVPTPPTPTPAPSPTPSPTPSIFPGGVANDGPLAYYRLADGTSPSTFADASGHGYDATAHGTITTNASLLIGDANASENFVGSTGYGVMPSTMTDFHTSKFSVVWLMKTPASASTYTTIYPILQYYGVIVGRFTRTAGPPPVFSYGWGVGKTTGIASNNCPSPLIAASSTHFFAMTFDMTTTNPTVLGSVNGAAQVNCNPSPLISKTQVTTIPSYTTKQFISAQVGNNSMTAYNGISDEIVIFPYVLTLGQIQTLATLAGY